MSAGLTDWLPADRPALLLDIDGVLNVFQCPAAKEVAVAPHLPPFKLWPEAPGWLRQLDAAFCLVWCSSWGRLAEPLEPLLGIGRRPLLEPTADEAPLADWKWRAARRVFAGWPGPLAWVEDGFRAQARAWAAARLAGGAPTWLVDVSEAGLTAAVTADLLAWAREPR